MQYQEQHAVVTDRDDVEFRGQAMNKGEIAVLSSAPAKERRAFPDPPEGRL
jgi:hypothetical protein